MKISQTIPVQPPVDVWVAPIDAYTGSPLPYAEVIALDDEGNLVATGISNDDGWALLRLRRGTYNIQAWANGYQVAGDRYVITDNTEIIIACYPDTAGANSALEIEGVIIIPAPGVIIDPPHTLPVVRPPELGMGGNEIYIGLGIVAIAGLAWLAWRD